MTAAPGASKAATESSPLVFPESQCGTAFLTVAKPHETHIKHCQNTLQLSTHELLWLYNAKELYVLYTHTDPEISRL